ncbi:MAG: type II deoxyribonuclease [Candidatus Epulonipiscioides saccharophilum]|nr:MAG: type II deoxyribonuclease [Epulopiscium sp. AS2M-Bin001]
MNKSVIQKFAIQSRTDLIEQVKQQAFNYGIDENGCGDINAVSVNGFILDGNKINQRKALIEEIRKNGYEQTMEKAAYTWFNRFIALRFMEVNDYLPTHIRVFTNDKGEFKPEILQVATTIELDGIDREKVYQLLESASAEADLYRYLLLLQCNALHSLLPKMFEKMGDYLELLLPDNILGSNSVIANMVNNIPEEDWKEAVEIVGWLYQFYISDLNKLVYDGNMSKSRISKELLSPATTIYTPDWAIRYMVENSLGRLAVEKLNIEHKLMNWKYYLEEAEQTEEVIQQLKIINNKDNFKLEELKVIDPCMGSGHILVYAFDVLMQIYENQGYSSRETVRLIVENNLYGLDIDERAYQLAYFAIMMKARKYDRRFLTKGIAPQIYCPKGYTDGEEYGSILKINELEEKPQQIEKLTLFEEEYNLKLNTWNFRRLLSQKYDIVVTNPPYLGNARFSPNLDKYIKNNYYEVKSDLSMVMLRKAVDDLCKINGFVSFITTSSWMFLSSFEKLRKYLLNHCAFTSIVDFGTELFDGKVGHNPIVAWVNRKMPIRCKFIGVRLVDFCYSHKDEKEPEFFKVENHYIANQENFTKIPGNPIAYWVSEDILKAFKNGRKMGDILDAKEGLKTANNNRFLRLWYEVENNKYAMNCSSLEDALNSGMKWFPCNKGGERRQWYGNYDYLVNWENNGYEIRNFKDSNGKQRSGINSPQTYFKEAITWSDITTGDFAIRYRIPGSIHEATGMSAFGDNLNYLLGLLGSKIANHFFKILNPTIHLRIGNFSNFPVLKDEQCETKVVELVKENIAISKKDWDSFETSWDFEYHPLVDQKINEKTIADKFKQWENECNDRFNVLKANEEELNRMFIGIYGLQDELNPELEDKDITVRKADLAREIKSLISYAIGCIFGRYSLDVKGLAYAGGEFDNSKYTTFKPDVDNIIRICDDEYFEDDIVGKFIKFISVVYGEDELEENLEFIAKTLNPKGEAREVIRNYFLNEFYSDHCKIYKKRPIYWLFDSGKKNGFKGLIYMHRYSSDLLAKIRTDYVHEQQERYRIQIAILEDSAISATIKEKKNLEKRLKTLKEQTLEIRQFEEKIHHLADKNIDIDLDDGVLKNYEIFKDVIAKVK